MKSNVIRKIDGYSDRAIVIEKYGCRFLLSYRTIVCYFDEFGTFHRTWDGYSNTTVHNHVSRFIGSSMSKKEWESIPLSELPVVSINGKLVQLGYSDIVSYSDEHRKLPTMCDHVNAWGQYFEPKYAYGF